MIIKQTIPSSNYDKSRKPITHIVIHWIVGNLASADATFKNPARNASAHYGIEDSTIFQWVNEAHTAYHAGNYAYNQKSIGIEHSAAPDRPASEATYQTSGKLIAEIAKRYSIPLDRAHIVGHKEVSATQCPGTMDIDKLISIAKGGVNVDTQKIIDELRKARDDNWNKFLAEQAKVKELQTLLETSIAKLTACENKPVPANEDSKTLSELKTMLRRVIGI